jgi:hypothetical protein
MPVLRRHALKLALALLLAALPGTAQAQIDHEQRAYGSVCSGTGNGADWDTVFECNGSTWQRGPYFFGSSPDSCDSSHGGMVQWTGAALEYCDASAWTLFSTGAAAIYDLAVFYPGRLTGGAIVRVVAARTAHFATNLAGSSCVAKEGATASATVTLNQIHAGASTGVGTIVFGSGGGTNVTNCTFAAASGISLAAGDALEFVFPATADATLGDVAITLLGSH